jgi:hypothetical protein
MRTVCAALLLCLAGGTAAQATPIFYATAAATVTYHGIPSQQDSDSVLLYDVDTLGPISAALPGGSAFASVTDGALHAFATTNGLGVSSNAYAGFFDTLLLTSTTLAPGTHVSLLGELSFSRIVTPNGVGIPCGGGVVAYGGIDTNNALGAAGALFVQDHTCNNSDINSPTALIQGIIGGELTVNAFVNAGTSAFGPGTADASSLRFFLTPVGDFTYSTASGNLYLQPTADVPEVPEPGTLFLVGIGAAAITARARRRSSGVKR